MRYPKFLKDHGKIGLVATSFGCSTEPYHSLLQNAMKYFNEQQYTLLEGNNLFFNKMVASDDAINRAIDFCKMYQGEADIVWSIGGGEMMFDMLPYIPFSVFKELPAKYFIGYSDNTNLTFLLTTLCDIATIYGLHFPSFGTRELHKQNHDLLQLLRGEKLQFQSYLQYEIESLRKKDFLAPLHLTHNVRWEVFPEQFEVQMKGRIIGGCFDCLSLICGTKFDHVREFLEKYREDGFIWYLDVFDYSSIAFYRALLQLDYANWFQYVKGFVIGRVANFNEPFDFTYLHAIQSVLEKYDVPILYEADIGHVPPSLPILNGSIATISYHHHQATIQYELK